jgi:hypothetical protein
MWQCRYRSIIIDCGTKREVSVQLRAQAALPPLESNHGTYLTGGFVYSIHYGLYTLEKRNMLCLCRESTLAPLDAWRARHIKEKCY